MAPTATSTGGAACDDGDGGDGSSGGPAAAGAGRGRLGPVGGLGTLAFLAALWLTQRIRRAGRPDLAPLTAADTLPLVLASVSAATVGAVLVSRRPRHPVGWLLLGLGVSMTTIGAVGDYASYVLLAGGGPLPGARWAALLSDTGWILWPALIGFILLLTPTGSPPSRRWR